MGKGNWRKAMFLSQEKGTALWLIVVVIILKGRQAIQQETDSSQVVFQGTVPEWSKPETAGKNV